MKTEQEILKYVGERAAILIQALDKAAAAVAIPETVANATLAKVLEGFTGALLVKAHAARAKHGFKPLGWATPDWKPELQAGLIKHVFKGDPLDVAIYALFAWFHGWSTAPQASPEIENVAQAMLANLPPAAERDGDARDYGATLQLITHLLQSGAQHHQKPAAEPEPADQAERLRYKLPARNLHYQLADIALERDQQEDAGHNNATRTAIEAAFRAEQQQRDEQIVAALRAQLSNIERYDESLAEIATALGVTL